jgi:hypothetical protein
MVENKLYFMKHKFSYCLVFIAGIIFFISCKKNNPQKDKQSATLYDCTPKTIEPYICFDSLIQDSRCPIGAVCIWEGTAQIKISFREGTQIHPIKMELRKFPFPGFTNDTTINGYRIIFTDLKPYPEVNKPAPSAITAFFDISR